MYLRNCIACGSENISIAGRHSSTKSVFCAHCGTRTAQWLSEEDAINAWNGGDVIPLPDEEAVTTRNTFARKQGG